MTPDVWEPPFPIGKTEGGYDYSQMDEDLRFCFERGMNCVSMAAPGTSSSSRLTGEFEGALFSRHRDLVTGTASPYSQGQGEE